jgi:hypothetical protein
LLVNHRSQKGQKPGAIGSPNGRLEGPVDRLGTTEGAVFGSEGHAGKFSQPSVGVNSPGTINGNLPPLRFRPADDQDEFTRLDVL